MFSARISGSRQGTTHRHRSKRCGDHRCRSGWIIGKRRRSLVRSRSHLRGRGWAVRSDGAREMDGHRSLRISRRRCFSTSRFSRRSIASSSFPARLQVDLSFTPAAEFGARGPRFQLIFGEAVERPWTPPPPPEHIFGQGVHHAVRAHICIERGKFFQAEYWLHEVRNEALALACSRLGLEVRHGGGFDKLPASVHDAFAGSLVCSVTEAELRRALAIATSGLLNEAAHFPTIDKRVRPMLAEICQPASV